MSDTTKSLRPLVNRAACWESEHEPVITFFTDDGDEWGFPFFGLLAGNTRLGMKRWRCSGKAPKCEFKGRVRATSSEHSPKGARPPSKRTVRISFRCRCLCLPPLPPPPRAIKEKRAQMSDNGRKLCLSVLSLTCPTVSKDRATESGIARCSPLQECRCHKLPLARQSIGSNGNVEGVR